jgi:hypothetical protein
MQSAPALCPGPDESGAADGREVETALRRRLKSQSLGRSPVVGKDEAQTGQFAKIHACGPSGDS